MTAVEVARRLGVNERTVRRAVQDGRLRAVKRGRSFDIDLEEARAALSVRPSAPSPYQSALAEALELLRAFGYEGDARAVEERHGLVYVAPKAEVYVA